MPSACAGAIFSDLLAMPQTFVAVQCAFCHAFQGSLDKKNKKFCCAICGQKQSFRHVHAVSNSGKDIRVVVQQLNDLRGARGQATGDVDITETPLPQHLSCVELQKTLQWDAFAEPACEQNPGNDLDEGAAYVTALPDTVGGSRGGTASGQRSKKQKLQQEDAADCQYGVAGPAIWPNQPKSSSRVTQPSLDRPRRPPLQQRRPQQQSNQRIDNHHQGLQATNPASLQADSSWQWNPQQQQRQQSAASQQPQQQYSRKQGQHTQQPSWSRNAAGARLQQNQMPSPQLQQVSAGPASALGASQPQQPPATDQLRPCGSREWSASEQPQQQQQQQTGNSVWRPHKQQQDSMQHNPLPASNLRRPPLMQQQQPLRPPAGFPAELQKPAQQRKSAAASSSPWGSFVDENDAAAFTSDDDAGDVDEQGFCDAVPAFGATELAAAGVMMSKWV